MRAKTFLVYGFDSGVCVYEMALVTPIGKFIQQVVIHIIYLPQQSPHSYYVLWQPIRSENSIVRTTWATGHKRILKMIIDNFHNIIACSQTHPHTVLPLSGDLCLPHF